MKFKVGQKVKFNNDVGVIEEIHNVRTKTYKVVFDGRFTFYIKEKYLELHE